MDHYQEEYSGETSSSYHILLLRRNVESIFQIRDPNKESMVVSRLESRARIDGVCLGDCCHCVHAREIGPLQCRCKMQILLVVVIITSYYF